MQSEQSDSPLNVLKNANNLERLDREVSHKLLKKKTEKLSIAVYLVTGFLSDIEPIKWQARECGLKILSDITLAEDKNMSERERHMKSMSAEIGKIISLLEIAAAAGFVSPMNFSVLKEEYLSLIVAANRQKMNAPQESYVFSRDFFSSPESPLSSKTGDNPIRQGMRQDMLSDISAIKKPVKISEKSPRRETILRVIKDKGESSIKDIIGYISGHIPDCGEKTVQRELTALVEEGVLKKTGERRWSRYSFAV